MGGANEQEGPRPAAFSLVLPWPPSANHYYRHVGPRVLISRDGRRYREAVAEAARRSGAPMFTRPVEVSIDLHPPDNRRRDVDNCLKCTLDSLTCAGVYEDDSLIQKLTVTKCAPRPPLGMAAIWISDYDRAGTTGQDGAHTDG
jgi:Holliday junction resolvase RusA-like endonuclease